MVSRNLTEVFVLMRNNAIHSRQMYSEQGNDSERSRLMRSNSLLDPEAGLEMRGETYSPPPWIDSLEEAHYIISRLRTKITELQACHERQILRPALDDSTEKEDISRAAADIARHFGSVHRICGAIRTYGRQGTKTEQKLVNNVVLALVTTLQELSITFRTAQSNYLKSLTSREERSNAYLDLPNFEELSLENDTGLNKQTDFLFSLPSTSKSAYLENDIDQAFERPAMTQKQLMLLQEENTKMVEEREKEVNKIIKSITDLNDIFKDLASMVHDQGTILDRIDYNVEQTQVQVNEGFKQLKKAEQYQKKNRKMHCIMILTATIIVLFVLLIVVKS